jgi:hypothetical protein
VGTASATFRPLWGAVGAVIPREFAAALKPTEVREGSVMCGRLRAGKDFLHVLQHWSVQPCVRPFDAVSYDPGHNAFRGSGPDHSRI